MVSSLTDQNRDLLKQIGCATGIFQLFSRRHLLTSRSVNTLNQKRLLLVGGQQQMEPQNAIKDIKEKDLEVQKEKRRASSESPDIRDVVNGSMNRESRDVSIKSLANDKREVTVKHTDSPRPSVQSKFRKPKATAYEGTKRLKDDRLALLPRLSYDGRESKDAFNTNMKPRFSLDSKARPVKCSAFEPILNHSRSNSLVAKLMGMDAFPDCTTMDEISTTKINSTEKSSQSLIVEGRKQKQVSSSLPLPQRSPASPSPRSHNANSIKKNTRLPMEPAHLKQQDYNRGSSKMITQSGKAPKKIPHASTSVYGEIEKRIADLEFKRSSKDLRALKQILEAMQKTKGRLENHRGESAEQKVQERSSSKDSWSDQNYNFSSIQIFKCSSSNEFTSMEIMPLQKIQTPKYHRDNQAQKEKAKYHTLTDNMKEAKQHPQFTGKKNTWRKLELESTTKAPQCMVQNFPTSERESRMVSPRVEHIVLKTEREFHPKSSTSELGRAKKQSSKKEREKYPHNINQRTRSNDDQLSNHSGETSYSSCLGDAYHIERDTISSSSRVQEYVKTSIAQASAVEHAVIVAEQPSPVSVLETAFYGEGSPSPVKRKSTAFQDVNLSPDEVEWNLENLCNLTDYTDHNEPAYQSFNQGHSYITKMLLASPLLNDASIIQTANQRLSLCHLINPGMFHALDKKNVPMEKAVGKLIKKNDKMKLNQKIQKKVASDMFYEILARKLKLCGLFSMRRKRMTLQGLIKDVYLEIDHICRTQYCNFDDEDDGSIKLLTTDIKYQSDDWTDYNDEIPALVLDIERLIFKDLINEIITCEVVVRHRPKRLHRQLFTNKYPT